MEMNAQCQEADLRLRLAQQEQEIARLRKEIDHLSRHDALTGALNRHTLTELLAAELRRSLRTGHTFSFAVIAIDGFDGIADRLGSPTGDALLKRFAEIATGVLRSLDAFGRLDDERFGILLPATWLDDGVLALKRLKAAVMTENWQGIAPDLAIGFVAGLTANGPGDSADAIFERACQALAQTQHAGGDGIATLECDLPPMPPLPED